MRNIKHSSIFILLLILTSSFLTSNLELKKGKRICESHIKNWLGERFYRKNVRLIRSFGNGDPNKFTEKGFKKITEYHFEYEFNSCDILKCKIHLVIDTLGKFKLNEELKLKILKELLNNKAKYDSLIATAAKYFGDSRFDMEIMNTSKNRIKIEALDKDEFVEASGRTRNGIIIDPETLILKKKFKSVQEVNYNERLH